MPAYHQYAEVEKRSEINCFSNGLPLVASHLQPERFWKHFSQYSCNVYARKIIKKVIRVSAQQNNFRGETADQTWERNLSSYSGGWLLILRAFLDLACLFVLHIGNAQSTASAPVFRNYGKERHIQMMTSNDVEYNSFGCGQQSGYPIEIPYFGLTNGEAGISENSSRKKSEKKTRLLELFSVTLLFSLSLARFAGLLPDEQELKRSTNPFYPCTQSSSTAITRSKWRRTMHFATWWFTTPYQLSSKLVRDPDNDFDFR